MIENTSKEVTCAKGVEYEVFNKLKQIIEKIMVFGKCQLIF